MNILKLKCPVCNRHYSKEKLGSHLETHDLTPKEEAANYLIYLRRRKARLRQLCSYLKQKAQDYH